MSLNLVCGDSRETLKQLADCSVDAIVTDPPYELGFMGRAWDRSGIAYDLGLWRECLRVLKPGGHLLSFGGSRTYHRMACAIEDAGFEVRDQIMWIYGSGFPKSMDVSKAIDKAAGATREFIGVSSVTGTRKSAFAEMRQDSSSGVFGDASVNYLTAPATPEAAKWQGWGTALKPAHEPIIVARKPLSEGTVAANVLRWGTGGLNIEACRIGAEIIEQGRAGRSSMPSGTIAQEGGELKATARSYSEGRWPANVILDEEAGRVLDAQSGMSRSTKGKPRGASSGQGWGMTKTGSEYEDEGGASRFFYCAKASKQDRGDGNDHPTVKPTELMRYLVRLVTPCGGLVVDPFLGSGSTGKAALLEGFCFWGCDLDPHHVEIARRRITPQTQTTLFGEAA